ncbi:PolC-type DNA polymerase III [Paenactinomyces guangxiensis]|uniref:DNA polymerase III PolC-type n=1 Tax=Paenactinomyces guangxiensis TaxID=1490290 RepID=A0A7W1WQS6_9BACL|nr:PolC-type DNA polymerase III [Paenactinomyces guangxiensis]MBA4494367.1 PolC-type DNA polymerase III [Paenactinomyces guangxiensis]MBH8591578.1 PolC-type DNA polymerase III [Paenactinomyces guangxiensis]
MKVGHERLLKLFQEAKCPSEWLPHFELAFIEKVEVDPIKKTWLIHIHFPEPIPPEVWQGFQERVKQSFQRIASAHILFHYDRVETDQVLQKYWYWIKKKIHENVAPAFSGWLGKAEWKVENNQLHIHFPNPAMLRMAKQKELDTHIGNYYKKITQREIVIHFSSNKEEEAKDLFQEQRQQQDQALIQQALAEQAEAARQAIESAEESPVLEKKIGYDFHDEPVPLSSIHEEERRIVVKGKVFKSELRELKSGRKLLTFNLTDYTDSIACKIFARDKEDAQILGQIKDGDWLKVRGSVQFDTFVRDLVLMVNDLHETEPEERQDTAEEKRVELHCHTSMSAMDGVYDVKELVKRAASWGHPAIAITDHGVAQAFPEAYGAGKQHGVKILFGMEANIVNDGIPIVIRPEDRVLTEDTYVVFDVETTGLSAVHDTIIELAGVKVKNGEIIDRFESFANPHRPLTEQISQLTGITDEMVKDAPEVDQVISRFLEFIEGSVLVAHNARFDMGFLQEAVKRIGKEPVSNPVIDTLELARFLYPGMKNYRLNTLAAKLDVHLEQHHRAIYDAEATGYVMWKMLLDTVKKDITRLHQLNEHTGDRDLTRLRPFHAILLVKNETGLKNLYKLISKSHLETFFRVPRILRSELEKHREGLMIGSGCEKGELFETALNKSPQEVEEVARFYDYLEIQPVDINMHLVEKGLVETPDRLREANRLLVEIGEKLGKPVVATANVHYLDEHDSLYRDILAMNQSGGFRPSGPLPKAHFRTTTEMLEEFSYLGPDKAKEVVITNPRKIADLIQDDIKPFPDGTFTPKMEGAADELKQICYDKAHSLYGDPLPEVVATRLDRELTPIIKYGFSDLYLISQRIVTKSLQDGYLVGSRGSVGSSFVATMSDITEVNPLPPHWRCPSCKHSEFILDGSYESGFDLPDKECPNCGTKMEKDGHDIPFETFLGFEADKTPDIDLNFSGEYQPRAHAYTEELFGKEYIYRAGTIATVQEKTAYGYVKKYAEQNNLQLRQAEIERLVQGCTGVKRTTGQHPGGLMVVPQYKDVFDFTPIQHPADDAKSGTITTHFDYRSISGRLLKLDILGHQDPTTIRMLQDLTGVDPKEIPIDDPETIKIFSGTESLGITPEDINGTKTGTLGIPEFGTHFVRQMLEDTRPTTFSELVRISGLSHGTDVWLGNAQELIRSGTCTLSEAICTRDDIMLYLIQKGVPAKSAFKIMEKVRKGKGVTEDEAELMKEHGVPDWYITSCQKIAYMFPRAHAAAYVMMAVRIAWFKVHRPLEYYAAYFYRLLSDFDADVVLKGPAHIKRMIKEIEEKGNTASPKEKGLFTVLESVQEFYARGFTFKNVDLYRSHAKQFVIDGNSLIPPFASIAGVGENAAVNIMEARKEGEFLSIDDFQQRSRATSTVVEILKNMGCLDGLPQSNQLALF